MPRAETMAQSDGEVMSDSPQDLVGWFLGLLVTAIGGLVTAIFTMWKLNESKNSRAIESLQLVNEGLKSDVAECRRDREELRVEIAMLKGQLDRYIADQESGSDT